MIVHNNVKRMRGLAAMSPERRREIASKGGRTSQARGTVTSGRPKKPRKQERKAAHATRSETPGSATRPDFRV